MLVTLAFLFVFGIVAKTLLLKELDKTRDGIRLRW